MRPLKIELKNVGPYLNETIDFTDLSNVFLITGPTGSGKTFIFDAMTFALYGTVKGNRNNLEKSLKSNLCDNEAEAFVDFQFLLNGIKYRVKRFLPYNHITSGNKVQSKGDIPEVFRFSEKSNSYEPLWEGENPSVITEKIKSLIGLDVNEFSMVVVLPQGEFAKFLSQGSKERTETLSKLFPVDVYKDLMENVKERFTALSTELNGLVTSREALLQGRRLNELEEELKDLVKSGKIFEKSSEKLSAEINELSAKIVIAEQEMNQCRKYQENLQKKEKLEKVKNEIEGLEIKISEGRKANRVYPFYKAFVKNSENLSEMKKNFETGQKLYSQKCVAFEKLCSEKETVEELRKAIPDEKGRLEKLFSAEKILSEITEGKKDLEDLENEISETENILEDQKKILTEYEDQKLKEERNEIAAELSVLLKENEPCPVCGSIHHPSPAVKSEKTLDLGKKIEVLRKTVKSSESLLSEKQKTAEKLSGILSEKEKIFLGTGFKLPLPDSEELKREYETHLKKVSDFDSVFQTLYNEKEKMASTLEANKENIASFEKQTLESENEYRVQFEKSGFLSEEEFKTKAVSEDEISGMENRIISWNNEYSAVKALLESTEVKGSLEEAENKYSALSDELDEKTEAHKKLVLNLRENNTKTGKLKGLLDTAKKQENQIESMQNELAPLKKLYEDLFGKNPKKISFDAWALGVCFDEVLSVGGKRFQEISNGRYSFRMKNELSGNGKKGLDFVVCDTYYGTERELGTLSGGETFMASISLALAVTDVVQARNGGIQLDSLFIDEGFGTLDNETQDLAMEILSNLGQTKMIGIISHVDNLKNRLKSQVVVHKTTAGSHISQV